MSNRVVSEFYFSIIPEWLIESNISDNALRVYSALYRFADKDDGSCWPSIATIGRKCNKSTSSVKRAIKELKDHGAIEVKERFEDDKGQTSNLYILKLNPAFKSEPPPQTKNDTGGRSDMTHKPKSFNHSHNYKIGSSKSELFMALSSNLYEPKTKNEISSFNKVVKDLAEIGATPQDVQERIYIYKKKWPTMTLTPFALTKNWTLLGEMSEKDKPPVKRDCTQEGHEFIDLDVIYYCHHCNTEKSK
tara:strand:- start:155 stop:895 length:741 start_codon:yes stop_codon:yes gene_type:complete